MSRPIKLRAEDEDDLKVIAACLQDAIVPIGEMCFLPDERSFVLVVNRFKWEAMDGPGQSAADGFTADDDLFPFQRTHCGVRFDGVVGVKTRGIDLKDRTQFLDLLTLEADGEGIALRFAGGGCLRLVTGAWRCAVEDIGEPWPTSRKPGHPIVDD